MICRTIMMLEQVNTNCNRIIFVQARANPSLLELCRVQLKIIK